MIYLINNEIENFKSAESLVKFLYEIETQLFGGKAEAADTAPQELSPPGLVNQLVGIQADTRRELEKAHRIIQRLREASGVAEATPPKAPYEREGQALLGDKYANR